MDILKKIDELRIQKGWSINKLAEESLITQSTLSNLYTRKSQPSISTLTSICNGLGITLSQFFAESESDITKQDENTLIAEYSKLSQNNKNAVLNLIKNLNK